MDLFHTKEAFIAQQEVFAAKLRKAFLRQDSITILTAFCGICLILILYATIDLFTGCVESGPAGIISSPNYPENYPNGLSSCWQKVIVEEGQSLTLTARHFVVYSTYIMSCGFIQNTSSSISS